MIIKFTHPVGHTAFECDRYTCLHTESGAYDVEMTKADVRVGRYLIHNDPESGDFRRAYVMENGSTVDVIQ